MENGGEAQSTEVSGVSAIIEEGDGADANTPKDSGVTLICSAAFNGKFDVVKKCIEAGTNVNCKANGGVRPLHLAAIKGHADIVKFLLTNQAEIEATISEDGNTALHLAVYEGHAEVTEILINHGADVFAKSNHDSVLHKAGRSADTLKLVLNEIRKKSNGDADRLRSVINAPDTEGDTPIMWAVENGKFNETKLFLECQEIDIHRMNLKGWTVLHWAAHAGSLETVKLLLEKKVDPQIKDKNGDTAYDLARGKISEDAMYQIIADFLLKETDSSCLRRIVCW